MIDGTKEQTAPDDDLEILVEGEAKPKPRPRPEDDGGDDEIAALRSTVDGAQKKTAEAEEARRTAERERDEARARTRAAIDAQVSEREVAIETSIVTFANTVDTLKKDYKAALEAGDHDRAAEINDQLVDAKIELRTNQGRKTELKAWKDDQVKKREAAERAAPVDPLSPYTPRTRAWIEKHADESGKPKFLTDRTFALKASAADSMAKAEGFAPDTDAYFDYVEKFMGLKPNDNADDDDDVVIQPAPKRVPPASSVAAPPSRGNGSGQQRSTTGRQTIRLTQQQRDFAETQSSLGETPAERVKNYAINLSKAIANQEIKGNA